MKTYVSTLKAMAINYGEGHRWDYLDRMVCEGAAAEIERLRNALREIADDPTSDLEGTRAYAGRVLDQ